MSQELDPDQVPSVVVVEDYERGVSIRLESNQHSLSTLDAAGSYALEFLDD